MAATKLGSSVIAVVSHGINESKLDALETMR